MRNRLFGHIMSLSLDYFETEKTGKIIARMTSDIDAMQELISQGLVLFVQNIFLFTGAVVVILVMSWELALGVLVIVPPVFFASRWFRRVSNKAYLDVRDSISTNLSTLQEGLEGVRVVQAFGREGSFTDRFWRTNEDQYLANMVTVKISSRVLPVHRVRRGRGHGGHRRLRRLARLPRCRAGRCRRRVRAVSPERVRPDQPAEPALQHGAVGRCGDAQDLRRPRHPGVDQGASGRGRPRPRRRHRGRPRHVRVRHQRARAPRRQPARSSPASESRSSARPAPGSRRWPSSSPGSTTRPKAPCASAVSTSATPPCSRCATGSSSCRKKGSCSPDRSARTSASAGPTLPTPRSTKRSKRSGCSSGSARSRRPRHGGARARIPALGGGAPAHLTGPRRAGRSRGARARRGDVEPRPGNRAPRRAGDGAAHARPHRDRRRAPAVDRGARRPHRVVLDGRLAELGSHAELVARGEHYAELYRTWSVHQAQPRVPDVA